MATDQLLIQIRVDSQLKEQASEAFDKIGIDIPTAVRMFFKAAVRDQNLPINTNVAGNGDPSKQQREAEQIFRLFFDMLMEDYPKNLKRKNKK